MKATECSRTSPELLAEEQRSLGPLWYRSEYLCEFTETIDAVFSHEHVMGALSSDVKPVFGGSQ